MVEPTLKAKPKMVRRIARILKRHETKRLSLLRPLEREVLELRLTGWSLSQIATQFARTAESVRQRQERALLVLTTGKRPKLGRPRLKTRRHHGTG